MRRLSNALLGVAVAESRGAHRPAQQLEVAIPDDLEITRENVNVD
jgi:hypothetical protein